MKARGYAAPSPKAPLAPWSFERREPRDTDVVMAVEYCGVCHSDLHQVRDEWSEGIFPMVPGHEIVGKVTRVGAAVKKFKLGDRAGVGCLVNSDRTCDNCRQGLEQYCTGGAVLTYNGRDYEGNPTYGGYSDCLVVNEAFALRIPDALAPDAAAPLLCAGITTYSPLRHWEVGKGQRVGIIGLGGLGHMALQFAHAFGAETFLFTHSPGKREDARKLGADEIVVAREPADFKHLNGSFDFLLDTVSAPHDLGAYLQLLRRDGTMTLVGVPPESSRLAAFPLILGRRRLAGSAIGGIAETQEMLDFCAAQGVRCWIETIPISAINQAYERMLRSDVKYRFVIDIASLR